jgi:hypothetical protein
MEPLGVVTILAFVVLLAWGAVAAWVTREAAKAGQANAATWGLAVLCTGPAGLVAYLAFGSPKTPNGASKSRALR